MNLRTWMGAAAVLACAACTHAPEHPAAMARIDGDQHVVVRAEAGRIWWAHRAWSEPHALWTLPARGAVQNLAVAREGDGFVVTFDQEGSMWRGTFGQAPTGAKRLAGISSDRSER